MKSFEQIRNKDGRMVCNGCGCIENIKEIDQIQKETALAVIDTIKNFALWQGGNTPQEKIDLFFKALQELKQQIK